jgi:hypothetical protein
LCRTLMVSPSRTETTVSETRGDCLTLHGTLDRLRGHGSPTACIV